MRYNTRQQSFFMPDLYISDEKIPVQEKPAAAVPPSTPQETQIDVNKNEPHILASFHENPEGITLVNQGQDEEILLFLRHHYITNIPWQTATVVLCHPSHPCFCSAALSLAPFYHSYQIYCNSCSLLLLDSFWLCLYQLCRLVL